MSANWIDHRLQKARHGLDRLDAMFSMFCVLLALCAGGAWLAALAGYHDVEQFYFADFGIKMIYCGSALLNASLAALLIRRLSVSEAGASCVSIDRAIVVLTALGAALPWAELWYAAGVDARYFQPSIGTSTNFGAVGCIAFVGYLVIRVPGMRLVRAHDGVLRVLVTLGAVGALIAVFRYLGRH